MEHTEKDKQENITNDDVIEVSDASNAEFEKIDISEFEDFVNETKNISDAQTETDFEQEKEQIINDDNVKVTITDAQKALATSFVDLITFITEFSIEKTILKQYDNVIFDAFTEKERKHLINAYAGLINYYNLEKYASPAITAIFVTATCVFGSINKAKKLKKELDKEKKQANNNIVQEYNNIIDTHTDNIPNEVPKKKRGRPRKNKANNE